MSGEVAAVGGRVRAFPASGLARRHRHPHRDGRLAEVDVRVLLETDESLAALARDPRWTLSRGNGWVVATRIDGV